MQYQKQRVLPYIFSSWARLQEQRAHHSSLKIQLPRKVENLLVNQEHSARHSSLFQSPSNSLYTTCGNKSVLMCINLTDPVDGDMKSFSFVKIFFSKYSFLFLHNYSSTRKVAQIIWDLKDPTNIQRLEKLHQYSVSGKIARIVCDRKGRTIILWLKRLRQNFVIGISCHYSLDGNLGRCEMSPYLLQSRPQLEMTFFMEK